MPPAKRRCGLHEIANPNMSPHAANHREELRATRPAHRKQIPPATQNSPPAIATSYTATRLQRYGTEFPTPTASSNIASTAGLGSSPRLATTVTSAPA